MALTLQVNFEGLSEKSLILLKLLNSLEAELEVPYLERRMRGHSQRLNSIEELQDAIQEIQQREKDLLAAIGISKVLLDNNESLQAKVHSQEDQKSSLESLVQEHVKEEERLKNDLEIFELKYQEVNAALVRSESKLLRLSAESKKTKEESHIRTSSHQEFHTSSIDKYDEEIDELTTKFKQEYEYVLSIF